MGSPFEGNQAMYSEDSDDIFLFPNAVPHTGTYVRNTGQVNPEYVQNVRPDILICNPLLPLLSLSDNPYPGVPQIFNEVSSHFI